MNGDVFVVDDNPDNLTLLVGILRRQGYRVRVADSGRRALEMIRALLPELILLDISMPEMDGYEVCRELKKDAATNAVPVLFISALDDAGDKVRGFESGAVDYIGKPFQAPEVIARVESHLKLGRLQKALEARNAELSRLNAEKDEFLGIAAHDLKSPLSVIRGYAEMLREHPETDEEARDAYLARIATASSRMAQLIQDLLDVNAIERGALVIRTEPVDLAEAARLVVESHQEAARAKGQTLRFEEPTGSTVALADAVFLPQMIENLVSNALKYSPHGKPVLVRIANAANTLRLEVVDEGPGLSSDDQAKLFGKFARLSAKPTGGEHTTGLGLSIVKRLVESMNGRVGCISTAGAGATFFLELPAA